MTLPHKSLLMAWATRGRHQLGIYTAGPRSPEGPRMPSDWLGCDRLCQPVSTRVSLCQTQEACQAQMLPVSDSGERRRRECRAGAHWSTLEHTGALWCTLEHRALDSTGALRSVGAACAAGGSFPRSVGLPPPDRRYLPEREKMQFLGEDEK